jgi:hypothetical protein
MYSFPLCISCIWHAYVGLKTDSFYPVPFRPFFYIMLLFPFLPNYKKLSDSINFNFILHYFVVAYFHKCRKISFRSDRFSTFVIPCSTFFDRFHPYAQGSRLRRGRQPTSPRGLTGSTRRSAPRGLDALREVSTVSQALPGTEDTPAGL